MLRCWALTAMTMLATLRLAKLFKPVCSLHQYSSVRAITFQQPCRMSIQDTIYALSSGAMVKSGVAVIRLSGPRSYSILERLTSVKPVSDSAKKSKSFQPRYASLRKIYCPESGDLLDEALVLWFPGPNRYPYRRFSLI